MAGKKRVISHRDFVRDLGRGALGEDIVEAFFRDEFGLQAKNVSDNNPDYDIVIDDICEDLKKGKKVAPGRLLKKVFRDSFGITKKKEVSVEVKFDEAAARYKNFFFEIFFNIDTGSPGTIFKCKADLIVWVVPLRKRFKVYVFKRSELLAWLFEYLFHNKKNLKYKTPGISPYARGVAIPIKAVSVSAACVGVFDYKL